MEFLDTIGEWFSSFFGWIQNLMSGLFGSSNERRIRDMGFVRDKAGNATVVPGSVIDRINSLEPEYEKLSEGELKQCSSRFRERLADGETLDDILPEAFAAVRESSRRVLGMRHYDVQMVGGCILHNGQIAEMVTGEGKTLVATLPSYLNALSGHVHVVTVNDYLAKRDMEWMGPVHISLGLTVGAIQANMSPHERKKHYEHDVTYGTNNEFGFDYLRDNMKPTRDLQVQGPLNMAVVDEIDNILIDEARTPLIILGPAHDDITKYPKANRIALQLQRGVDFEVKEKEHTCHLTEDGVRHAEELAGVDSFYTVGNMEWPHLIDNSLRAHHLYKRDVNYVVENGQVVIVDEFTGRKMEGRQWSDGLHQAVEAKEGVRIKEESQTLATITLQNYFKLYDKLAGMTGTAMTEAGEFWKIYKLEVVAVPTNRPLKRVNHTDVIYMSEREKWNAVVDEVAEVHQSGRPILVGTTSIEQSESLHNKLTRRGVKSNVLNAKHHQREAEIIAQAGRKEAVTIATNMAGRGTDIILGGNPDHLAWEELKTRYESRLDVSKQEWDDMTNSIAERDGMVEEGRQVADLGGLHVVGTERHDSRRIDLQLRGRAGRQGDPGSSRFFISLEDKLMRLFAGEWVKNLLGRIGMQEGEAIESRMVSKRVEGAQKKIEERHFDQRKHLLDYDEVMDEQRKQVYSYRQRILDGTNCRDLIIEMANDQIDRWCRHLLDRDYRWETIAAWAKQGILVGTGPGKVHLEFVPSDVRGMDRRGLEEYLHDEARRQGEDQVHDQLEMHLPTDLEGESESDWNWLALSRWANAQWGLNTNDRELKKIGRDHLAGDLMERANAAIEKLDYSPLDQLMVSDFGERSVCAWLASQFVLHMQVEDLGDADDVDSVIATIQERVRNAYHEKEILFPVAVGMTNFLADDRQSGDKYDRDGLLAWANGRFASNLAADDLKNKPRSEIEQLLADCSRGYFVDEDVSSKIDNILDSAYDARAETEGNGQSQHEEGLAQIAEWANTEFKCDVNRDEFAPLTRDGTRDKLLAEFDNRYRPELCQAERSLILEVLDTAWKDHLYYMDHLRSGIGLVGYAQKDPKVEYKREGRKAFDGMWERVSEQVTSAIFRLEKESPAFVGSLWEITAVTHEEAATSADYDEPQGTQNPQPGQAPTAVETIVNRVPKVGRNEPCPCGSGKKYKKCHGS